MQHIDKKSTKRLAEDPVSFAIMMDDSQLEQIIAAFVSVLIQRIKDRGG